MKSVRIDFRREIARCVLFVCGGREGARGAPFDGIKNALSRVFISFSGKDSKLVTLQMSCSSFTVKF